MEVESCRRSFILLQEQQPDILGLQEVYNGNDPQLEERFRSLEALTAELEYPYHYYSTEFIDNRAEGKIPQGNAIFSKFPLRETSTVFFDRPLDEYYVELPENYPTISRNLQLAAVETPVGLVWVYNFHGVWDLDGDNDSPARQRMCDVLLRAVGQKTNVIIMGDTNAKPTNPAIRRLEHSLTSVFGDRVATTFNMKRKDNPGYATAAVDMMFVGRTIQVVGSEVPNVDISDHLPLVVTVVIGEK